MSFNIEECVIPILLKARTAGSKGVVLSDAIKEMPWVCGLSRPGLKGNWSHDGSLPGHSGDAVIGSAILKLVSGNFISLSSAEAPDLHEQILDLSQEFSTTTLSVSFDLGYDCARLLNGFERSTYIQLNSGFFAAQEVLGFSLTEKAMRSSDSVLITPNFDFPSKVPFDVFVIMPFSDEYRLVYEDAIIKSARQCDLSIGRGDCFSDSRHVMHDIWSSIYNAHSIVADCTSRNANVFYELGIAHTLGKDVFLITQDEEEIPFDLRQWRHHKYRPTSISLEKLSEKLVNFFKR